MPTPHTPSIDVSRAKATDLDEVANLFDEYRQFYGQATDLSAARAFLCERVERSESVIFLARQAARAVGFVQLFPSFSSVALQPIWILNDLYVAPELRRSGVATALLTSAETHALHTNAARLVLATATDNLPARTLYESSGWQQDQAFLHYLKTL